MASEKQKAASRANGPKSRRPLLPKGDSDPPRSPLARTGVEGGMLARTVVLDGESHRRFHALMTSLQEELKPETAIENLLIYKMAIAHWRLMRVRGMERSGLSNEVDETGQPEPPDALTRDALAFSKSGVHLNEYEMRFDRQFTRAVLPPCARFERFRITRTRHVQQIKAPRVQR